MILVDCAFHSVSTNRNTRPGGGQVSLVSPYYSASWYLAWYHVISEMLILWQPHSENRHIFLRFPQISSVSPCKTKCFGSFVPRPVSIPGYCPFLLLCFSVCFILSVKSVYDGSVVPQIWQWFYRDHRHFFKSLSFPRLTWLKPCCFGGSPIPWSEGGNADTHVQSWWVRETQILCRLSDPYNTYRNCWE